jgi:uncharacterized protein
MIAVVLDTNVIVSANLRPDGSEAQVVSLALNKKLKLYVSPPILSEYETVLLYPHLKLVPDEVKAFMALLRSVSEVVKPKQRLTISPDDADNRFYECAEAAKASFLVTGNRKHFPKDHKVTRIVNARELLDSVTVGHNLDI